MKYKLKRKTNLSELSPALAYAGGLYLAGLANPITRGAVLSATGNAASLLKNTAVNTAKLLTSPAAITAYKTVGKGLGALGTGAVAATRVGYDMAKDAYKDYKDYLEKPVSYHKVNKKTGKREKAFAPRGDVETAKKFKKARNLMLASECINLISKISNKSIKESKKLFKVLYKDFVIESSKYLKESMNPNNTLMLFKGYLESIWTTQKKSSLKS